MRYERIQQTGAGAALHLGDDLLMKGNSEMSNCKPQARALVLMGNQLTTTKSVDGVQRTRTYVEGRKERVEIYFWRGAPLQNHCGPLHWHA